MALSNFWPASPEVNGSVYFISLLNIFWCTLILLYVGLRARHVFVNTDTSHRNASSDSTERLTLTRRVNRDSRETLSIFAVFVIGQIGLLAASAELSAHMLRHQVR